MKKQDDAGECVFPLPGAGPRDGGSFLVDFVNPDCPQNAAGLELGAAYEFKQENGFRVCNNLHEYSAWLEELDDLVGSHEDTLDADEHGPFRELIHYGGLGEIIGPVASAKLVADFIAWDERARSLSDDAFYEWYARMRKVFEYAGEAGAVWSEGETYR
ncbi:hypothetical protein ACQUJV_05720 [Ralstonia pseudosolanacearum]